MRTREAGSGRILGSTAAKPVGHRSAWYLPDDMPIPINALNEARKPLPERIVNALSSNPGLAFTPAEIYEKVTGRRVLEVALMEDGSRVRLIDAWLDAVNALVAAGRIVETKHDDGNLYYHYRVAS